MILEKDLIKITAETQYTLFLVLQCSREGIYFTITFALPPKCLNLYILFFFFKRFKFFFLTLVILPTFVTERILTRHHFGKLNLKHGFSIGFKG